MKILISTGIPGIKAEVEIDHDSYIAIESHVQNAQIHNAAIRAGDSAAVDAIAPIIDMDKDDSHAAGMDALKKASKCSDRKTRCAYKRLYSRALKEIRMPTDRH